MDTTEPKPRPEFGTPASGEQPRCYRCNRPMERQKVMICGACGVALSRMLDWREGRRNP